ncbi:hypothetical protein Pmani_035442 [Petrolisthes manimaculis]|uniref:Uncharacterized protein n=1 Tax=Petrolisthes manimaculis TaxID=1843537 RepID=A0AAE1TNQ5_9EUCA|nr:hypothetical protein Pmani_035442 [Petrolisthes manimaculis]
MEWRKGKVGGGEEGDGGGVEGDRDGGGEEWRREMETGWRVGGGRWKREMEVESMSFRDKGVRKACWESRDRYWACLDLPDSIHRDHCLELRRLYEMACPVHWVKHFDRKRQYMEFKERIHSTPGVVPTGVALSRP